MSFFRPASAAAAILVAALSPALAPAQAQTKAKGDEPSVYLRCDGSPSHRSIGESLGRALLLGATMGIAGKGETQDASKRAHGLEGVDACLLAVQQESDPIRKVQLMLARAVHQIEKGDFAAAVDDARKAPSLAGADASDVGFRHGLGVSALEIQAAALLRAGRLAEAEATAIQMADAAPYEVIAQIHAAPYVQLTADLTPAKQAYLDRLVKLFPEALVYRASAYEWAGRYLDAAADYGAITDSWAAFAPDGNPPPLPGVLALRSVMLALAGKMSESTALAVNTSAMLRVLTATGKAGLMKNSVDAAEQALDFRGIVQDLAEGRAAMARIKFAARSRWSVPSAPVVAELATRLRQGAPAAELTGPLASDPARLRSEALTANAGAITEEKDAVASLYAIRAPVRPGTYAEWADDVWNTQSSVLLYKRAPGENYVGEVLRVDRTPKLFVKGHLLTVATGEALVMHAALLAQARGSKGFAIFPKRDQLDVLIVRFGDPGSAGMPAGATFDAATVVQDLSGEFPDPRLKR